MAATETTDNWAGVAWPVLAVGLVALVHVGALLVFQSTPSLGSAATLAGVVLAALLVAIGVTEGVDPLPVTGVAYVAATAATWAVLSVGDLLVAALAVVGGCALLSYGLHRYELVALDLVEVADE